jgi:flagellar protein FliJ
VKAFHFNMEQVLRMKRWREEEAKKALAVEVAALESLKARLEELRGEMRGLWGEIGESAAAEVDFRGRLGVLQYARHLGGLIAGQEGSMASQGARLKEKADALLQAMQERKVLEKLKERRALEHRQERNRHDYANLDEASARLLRRNSERMPEGTAEGLFDPGKGTPA